MRSKRLTSNLTCTPSPKTKTNYFEYLPNIYMTNDNAETGEVSCINAYNVFFCGGSNYVEKRMSNRNIQHCLSFVEMAAFGSCIGFMSTNGYKFICVLLNRKINRKLSILTSKPSHIPNAFPCLYQETPQSSIKPTSSSLYLKCFFFE
jgi:hypothetical protein